MSLECSLNHLLGPRLHAAEYLSPAVYTANTTRATSSAVDCTDLAMLIYVDGHMNFQDAVHSTSLLNDTRCARPSAI